MLAAILAKEIRGIRAVADIGGTGLPGATMHCGKRWAYLSPTTTCAIGTIMDVGHCVFRSAETSFTVAHWQGQQGAAEQPRGPAVLTSATLRLDVRPMADAARAPLAAGNQKLGLLAALLRVSIEGSWCIYGCWLRCCKPGGVSPSGQVDK